MNEKRIGTGNTISYELTGSVLSFNDGELMINLKKYEKDFPRQLDICEDGYGCLCMGLSQNYVAQVEIPARSYVEVENGVDSDGHPRIEKQPVPFNPELVTITLWDKED